MVVRRQLAEFPRRCTRGYNLRWLLPAMVRHDGSFIAPAILGAVGRDPARESFPANSSGVGIVG